MRMIIILVVALSFVLFFSSKKKEVKTPPSPPKPKINRNSADLLDKYNNVPINTNLPDVTVTGQMQTDNSSLLNQLNS